MRDILRPSRRAALGVGFVLTSALALAATSARAEDDPTPAGLPRPTGDVHDFDYHVGDWTAVNRRLKQRWVNGNDWDEFPGTTRYQSFMDSMVSLDVTTFPTKGFAGTTVRTFNLARKQWFIYWINNRDGVMGTPMIGGYSGNVGLFYGDDTDGDIPVKARFIRTKRPPDRERWEQAFSRDGSKTWETNWSADFTRVA